MTFRGFVLFVTFFSLGMSPVGATSAWTGPTQSPPNGNVAAPLNVSATDQQKNGWIGLDSLSIFKDMIISGSHGGLEPNIRYLNFGAGGWGNTGYGIRDNAGTLEFKNNGGSWQSLQNIVYSLVGGAGSWTASGNNIYNNNTGNVGIGTQNPGAKLEVAGAIKPGNVTTGASCTPEGALGYDTSAHAPVYCSSGLVWTSIGSGSSGSCTTQTTTYSTVGTFTWTKPAAPGCTSVTFKCWGGGGGGGIGGYTPGDSQWAGGGGGGGGFGMVSVPIASVGSSVTVRVGAGGAGGGSPSNGGDSAINDSLLVKSRTTS